jgi:ABC-type oligopeptide transport system substrate-binding subunit
MPFTAPVPWEAVERWDGEEGRDFFKDHPVGAGPFRLAEFERQSHITLERNPNFYGLRHPEWQAPAALYPSEGEPEDFALGRLDPAYVGQPLPFLERVEFRIEKEAIPTFNKFLQGYYDASGILQESFDKMVHEGALSEEMATSGMQLEKSVDPDVYYIGFNMDDPVVGTPAGDKGRRLRQAMSLVVDAREYARVFNNGRGVPAQSPLPPGIFGYEADYENPFRQVDRRGLRPARPVCERHRSSDGPAAAPLLRPRRHVDARARALPVLRERVEPARDRRRDRCDDVQPVPGEGAQERLSDLHVGLDRGLSRSRELPVPAVGAARELEEPWLQHR